jgi:hypothetical protein
LECLVSRVCKVNQAAMKTNAIEVVDGNWPKLERDKLFPTCHHWKLWDNVDDQAGWGNRGPWNWLDWAFCCKWNVSVCAY